MVKFVIVLAMWLGQSVSAVQPPVAESSAKRTLVLAAYMYREPAVVLAEYQPLVNYLNAQLKNIHVDLRVMAMAELNAAIANSSVDIVSTNPTHYLQIRYQKHTSGPIATLVRNHEGVKDARLGGVIVTKANRNDINQLSDIVGKRIVTPSKEHLGGYWAQLDELHKAHLPQPDPKLLIVSGAGHISALKALISGQADVAFIRTGLLDVLNDSSGLSRNDFKAINVKPTTDFSHLRSTDLFPEWPVFALSHVLESDVRQVASALYGFEGAGSIFAFTVPADYLKLETLARNLRLPPFDGEPYFNLKDAVNKWSSQLFVVLAFLFLLILLAIILAVVLKRARQDRATLQLLMSSLGEGVIGVNAQAKCTFVNVVMLTMSGYKQEQMVDQSVCHLFDRWVDNFPVQVGDGPILQTLKDGQSRSLEARLLLQNGKRLAVHLTVSAMIEFGVVTGAEVIVQDISKQKETELRLFRLANYDDMTGFINRRYFVEQLMKNFMHGVRFGQSMSLLMLDLDHFKTINDTYGHAAGDAALISFAKVVQSMLSEGDWAGRMGGEEFAVLKIDRLETVMQWAQTLRESIAKLEVCHGMQCFHFTVSIGIAPLNARENNIDQWLARADKHLYHAKNAGRNRVEVSN